PQGSVDVPRYGRARARVARHRTAHPVDAARRRLDVLQEVHRQVAGATDPAPVVSREPTRSGLTPVTQNDNRPHHAPAAPASMRAYAGRYGEDPDAWGVAGMLHDFDYEMHPRAPHHPVKGAEILISRGVPEPIVHAILAHADYSGVPRVSRLDKALYACDELSGFVHAVALVRPGRVSTGLEPSSVT